MEPLAPGTEDDPLYTQVNKPSKKETAEEQALSKKGFLANGKYGNVFELNYVQGAQHWYCKVCDCPVLGRLFNHEIGKRHTTNMEKWNKTSDSSSKADDGPSDGSGTDVSPIVVAPGEPVPPGFEGEVEKSTQIQERLDGFNVGPLVGLEYLLELLDYDPSKEPLYLCILCDKKGDPRTVLTHLSSYNHQVMYLQKHFPTVYRHIAPFMIKQYKRNWQSGLQKIAEAIESTFGRLKPMAVEASRFEKDRMHYIEIVAKGKHFNELTGHTFEKVVSKEELTKVHEEPKPYDSNLPFRKMAPLVVAKRKSPSPPVVARPLKKPKPPPENKGRRKSLSPVSDISSSDLEDFDPKTQTKPTKESQRIIRESSFMKRSSPLIRRRSPSPRRKEGAMPWQKSNYRRNKVAPSVDKKKDEKTEKIEEYKKLCKAIDNDMEQVYKKNKQNPEKHPKYNDEWKKFWNARYKELQAEGKNASTHDFKPEWIEFWNKRMLDLHQEEIKTKKIALRKRLGLPEEPTPISFKIGERRKPAESGSRDTRPVPTAAQPDNDPEVIVIEDNDKDSERSISPPTRNRRKSRSPVRRRDRSPQFRRRSPHDRRDSPPKRRSSPLVRRGSPPIRRGSPSGRRSSPPARRSSPPIRRDSPPVRRSSPPVRRDSPPTRRGSPPVRRGSPPVRRGSPPVRRGSPSPERKRTSLDRSREKKVSPAPARKSPTVRISPSSSRLSPVSRREREILRFSPPPRRYSIERSPGPDRFGRTRERSPDRGRSRDISWERERDRHYKDLHWERSYRSRPPWEGPGWDPYKTAPLDPYAPPKILRDVTREPVRDLPDMDDDEEVNIVAVLRHLTALEERLGSLGPKVIDLLGQALAMEKKTANSSEGLLDSDINCVLFETVKEKLKGQLLAGFVDRIQEKAFKNAIKKTASLIHMAGERKKQREVELPKKPVVVPGVGTVDKGKIARQIANALIAQGKTDVTQAELEQLINAVVGIAEAQKSSSQPLTTASFLEKLASGGSYEEKKEESHSKSSTSSSEKEKEKEPKKAASPKIEEDQEASNSSLDKSTINMEGLSDADLQTLLQNFKDLSTEEQHGLINYLKKLEAKEPERVEKLRKFVNLTENLEEKKESGRFSPFSNRSGSINPSSKDNESGETRKTEKKEDKSSSFVNIDSEEEDYSFEDVAKAASQKVNEKEMERKRIEEEAKKETDDRNLNDAKALITSLMSSLNKHNAAGGAGSSNVPTTSASSTADAKQAAAAGKINIISNVPVSSADLAKSLSGITMSMSSLDSILGNVQNLTRQNQAAASTPAPDPKPAQENQPKPNPLPPTISNLTPDKPSPRNYNDFDIGSQKDVRAKPEFVPNEPPRNRAPSRSYDEFNIGPNPGEFRDEMGGEREGGRGPGFGPGRDNRGSGPGFYNKTHGFPERNLPAQDRNPHFAPAGGPGFRGNPGHGGPSPSFSNQNQYAPRTGASPVNKMPPRGNSFDMRGGPGDFGPDRGDFGPDRGDFGPDRGDFGPDRGDFGSDRGDFGSDRGDFRPVMKEPRGGMGDFRGGMGDSRGGPPGDFRGNPGDFRGTSAEFRASADFRGNDFRGDNRGPPPGAFRGGNDDLRNNAGPGPSRGGPPPKGGMVIDPNRLGNSAPQRFSGNFGGNNNFNSNFRRW